MTANSYVCMLEEDCLIRDSDGFAIAPESIQEKGMAIDCSPFPLEEVAEEAAEEEEEEEGEIPTWAIYAGVITAGAVVFVLCLYQLSNLCCKYKRWEDPDKDKSDRGESSDQENEVPSTPTKNNQVGNVPQTDVSTVPT